MTDILIIDGKVDTLLDAVSTTGAGAAKNTNRLHKTFHIDITGTATVDIQGSYSGSGPWTSLTPSGVLASTDLTNSDVYGWFRAEVTAYTSGNVSVRLST